MQLVTFIADFRFVENARDTKTYPAGWSGVVSDEVAEAAIDAGAIEGAEQVAEDDSLADDAAALAEMTGAEADTDLPPPVAPAAPDKTKK